MDRCLSTRLLATACVYLVSIGIFFFLLVFSRHNFHAEDQERVTCTATAIADWRA
jgi:hypothetical protein